jgi:hypothetical protein
MYFQKMYAMQAPVRVAASDPAHDLRGARGRRRMGKRAGRRGVYDPRNRPIVEAAVSAQDRLCRGEWRSVDTYGQDGAEERTLGWIQRRRPPGIAIGRI